MSDDALSMILGALVRLEAKTNRIDEKTDRIEEQLGGVRDDIGVNMARADRVGKAVRGASGRGSGEATEES